MFTLGVLYWSQYRCAEPWNRTGLSGDLLVQVESTGAEASRFKMVSLPGVTFFCHSDFLFPLED